MERSAVRAIFSQVAPRYAAVNHLMTLGLDVLWRKRASHAALAGAPRLCLDVCTGTADMAICLQRAAPDALVVGLDFCEPMMVTGRRSARDSGIELLAGEVTRLPFADDAFDLVTIAFATRNINTSRAALLRAFAECRRVLKPAGCFVSVETSQPTCAPVRRVFHWYVRRLATPIAGFVSGAHGAYDYLAETIPSFYAPEELSATLIEAGFAEVSFRRMMLGAAAIHQAVK